MLFTNWLRGLAARILSRRPAGRRATRRQRTDHVPHLVAIERLEERAMLTDFVVNSTADGIGVGGAAVTTLREAVQAANTNASVDGSAAGAADGDRIFFDSTVFGGAGATINFAPGEVEFLIRDDVVIDGETGNGGGRTAVTIGGNLDGSLSHRIFTVSTAGAPGSRNVTLLGLTLQKGGSTGANNLGRGGAIYISSGENVQLVSTVLRANKANRSGGAIYNAGGTLILNGVTIGGSRSIDGNTAVGTGADDGGGGIFNAGGTINVFNSTISHNTATRDGGGISQPVGGTTVIRNSTISNNSANVNGGGIVIGTETDGNANGGTIDIESSTLAANFAERFGGGIAVHGGTATFRNNILGDQTGGASNQANRTNSGAAASVDTDYGGRTVSNGFNLVANDVFGGGFTRPTDLLGADPNLGPLADNGGRTATHLPLAGDAIGAGSSTVMFDQIGLRRRANTDIGAVETALVVSTTSDVDDGDYSTGLSLREAIDLANRRLGLQSITFDTAVFPAGVETSINLNGTELFIRDDVEIVGLGLDRIRINARSLSRHFSVSRARAVLSGLKLVYGNASIGGSILVYGDAQVEIVDSLLNENNAANGGAIYSAGTARVEVVRSSLNFNNASNRGGAIIGGDGSTIVVRESTLFANTAIRGGGLYEVLSNSVLFVNSTISRNTAVHGGGINARAGLLTLRHTSVLNNRSTGTGGGLLLQTQVQSVFTNSLFIGNRNLNGAGDADIVGIVQFGNVVAQQSAFNIIGTAIFTGGIQNGVAGNQTGFFILQVVDSVARDNGGPTLTHRLVAGGPAVNVNPPDAGTPPTDQRGFARVVGGLLDVGSLELEMM